MADIEQATVPSTGANIRFFQAEPAPWFTILLKVRLPPPLYRSGLGVTLPGRRQSLRVCQKETAIDTMQVIGIAPFFKPFTAAMFYGNWVRRYSVGFAQWCGGWAHFCGPEMEQMLILTQPTQGK